VLAAVFAAQLKRENYSDFPAGFRNPNKRREQLENSIYTGRRAAVYVNVSKRFRACWDWREEAEGPRYVWAIAKKSSSPLLARRARCG
jgi:hypothetical protein